MRKKGTHTMTARTHMLAPLPLAALGLALGFVQGLPACALAQEAQVSASSQTLGCLSDAQVRAEAAQEQLNDVNAAYFKAQGEYDRTTDELAEVQDDVASLESSVADLRSRLQQAQDTLAARMSATYQSGTTGLIDLLLSASDFDDLVTRVYYAGKVSDSDVELIAQIREEKEELEQKQASLEERQGRLEELQAQAKQQVVTLEAQLAEARQHKASLDADVSAWLDRAQAEEEADATRWKSKSAVVNEALSYLGCPYVWAAEGPSSFDCSGLTTVAYRASGVDIPHQSGMQYDEVCAAGGLKDADSLDVGDLVFFGYFGQEGVCHVGIYIGDGMIVHALPTSGVHTEELTSVCGYLNFLGGGSPA